MDAAGLIEATRDALARSTDGSDIVAEAWQAQALVQAVGDLLVMNGPPEVRAQANGLCEAGGWARGSLRDPARRGDAVRAEQLTEIRDPLSALDDLGGLLGESGAALFGVAVAAEEEALYWRCVVGIDAADECGDRVAEIRRRLVRRVPAAPVAGGEHTGHAGHTGHTVREDAGEEHTGRWEGATGPG